MFLKLKHYVIKIFQEVNNTQTVAIKTSFNVKAMIRMHWEIQ